MSDEPLVLRMPFLGQRTYLQGTTLFDALVPMVPDGARLTLKIQSPIRTDRVSVHRLPLGKSVEGLAAILDWETGSRSGTLTVSPLEPSHEIQRIPYDEDLIKNRAVFGENIVRFTGPSPYSFVATIVSLNKWMLLNCFPQPEAGQWLFARLDLDHHPTNVAEMVIRRRISLGARIVKSDIEVGGIALGELYFSWLVKQSDSHKK